MKSRKKKRHTVSLSSTLCTCKSTQAHDFTRVHSPLLSSVSRGGPPFRLPKTTSWRPSYGNSPAVADAETYSAYVNPLCLYSRTTTTNPLPSHEISRNPRFPRSNQRKIKRCGKPIGNNQFELHHARPIFHRTAKRTIWKNVSSSKKENMKVRWKSSRSFEGKERNRFHPKGRKMDGAYFQRDPPFSIRTQQNFIRSTFARLSSASRSATFFFFF